MTWCEKLETCENRKKNIFCNPKVRDLNEEEINKFKVDNKSHFFESTTLVFVTEHKCTTPTFRFYTLGTNQLKILRFNPKLDAWDDIDVDDIPNIYGLLYIIGTNMSLNETNYLLNSEKNKERLMASVKEFNETGGTKRELIED